MIIAKNIIVKSFCSHHIMPFVGVVSIAYIPSPSGNVLKDNEKGNIIGLSKFNRIVNYFAKRPQLQEQLVAQIHDFLNEILGENIGIAVYMEAKHTCVSHRGVEDDKSTMVTNKFSGVFKNNENLARQEFFNSISLK